MNSRPMFRALAGGTARALAPAALAVTLAATLPLGGCSEDNPAVPPTAPEHPEPTRMVLTLINTATPGDTVRATWADPDGVGSQPPSRIDTLRLAAGASYAGSLALFNDLKGIEVTPYIRDEGNQHQFFYTPDTAAAGRLTIVTTDKDTKGLPIGLTFTASVAAGEALDGRLNVVLSHFDDAPKDGVKRSPESDIDVDFPVTIR